MRALELEREAIETDFGEPLEWDHREGRKRCSVGVVLPGGGYRDPEQGWSAIQDRMVDAMGRLETAIRPKLLTAASQLAT